MQPQEEEFAALTVISIVMSSWAPVMVEPSRSLIEQLVFLLACNIAPTQLCLPQHQETICSVVSIMRLLHQQDQ
jgi:hypothetical protein